MLCECLVPSSMLLVDTETLDSDFWKWRTRNQTMFEAANPFALTTKPALEQRSFIRKLKKANLSNIVMDWQGQKLAEQLMQIMLLAFAVIAFVGGYVMASFQMMILIYAGGVVFTTLLTVPNWPLFNRHPLTWLDPTEVEKHPKPQPSVNVTQKKKPVKK
ncbi:putative signal peptidase complex subunit 1 [Glycine soja]|nr:putative signal peptidase complex subunit 1 [Glycine soja]